MDPLDLIKTSDLPATSVADALVVNRGADTFTISVDDHAAQILSTGPLAAALKNAAQGYVTTLSWPELQMLTGSRQGQAARVSEGDTGSHVDASTGETVANAGEYFWDAIDENWVWQGSTRLAPVIIATNAATSAPNAISASSTKSVGDGALVALPITLDSDEGAVTVSFNGGPALTLKDNSGEDLVTRAGQMIVGVVAGDAFKMVVDGVPAGLLDQIEDIRLAAEQAAETAQSLVGRAETALQPGAPIADIDGLSEALNEKATLDQVDQVIAGLGLGGSATLNVGASAGTVAAGNDARIVGAVQTVAIGVSIAPISSPEFQGSARVKNGSPGQKWLRRPCRWRSDRYRVSSFSQQGWQSNRLPRLCERDL